jgi:outer membrane lipoprotein-sorting protein
MIEQDFVRAQRLVRRRFFLLPVAAAALVLLSGAGQAPPPPRITFTPEQQADLDKVNAYLNGLHSLKSNFVQLGPEGQLDQGVLYIEKPGRMRFAYQAPSPTTIVATGGKVYVRNARLNTVVPYDLSDTPLGILLDDQVNLKANKAILGVQQQNDALVVQARTSANRNQSNIALVFSYPAIELRQWTVKDNQGGTTTVALTGTQTGVTLDDALFAVPVKTPKIKQGG